ncbi:MAG: tRNA lysidine(34) synthetase TilS [Sphingobium sp.]
MPEPLTPDLNRVFGVALAALVGDEAVSLGRFGVAVSGGPDSMALLDLAATAAPGRVEVATVDHGLRPEAAGEAEMVARCCAERGISHAILHPAEPIAGSVQAEARAARYALLDGWMTERGLDWLLTAHHADDQLETLLMRLNRASGVSGLAGIRARRGKVLRPLLGVRKADLEGWVRRRGIPHVTDPSNADERFDRARMRNRLAHVGWLDPMAAARSAAALGEAEAALDWSVARLVQDRVRQEGDTVRLEAEGLPREYLRRLLAHMVHLAAPDAPAPRGEQVDQAIVQLCDVKKLSIGACVATGGAIWTVRRAPPRRTG